MKEALINRGTGRMEKVAERMTIAGKEGSLKKSKSNILSDKRSMSAVRHSSQEVFVWDILGAESFMPEQPVSSLDLLKASQSGIQKRAIVSLANVMQLPLKDMAGLLNLSYKTLGRKKESETFGSMVSSLSIEIASTVAHGLTVFEDEVKFNRWLHKANRALKGQKPIDLLNTPTGIKLVNQIIGRIDEGVYS